MAKKTTVVPINPSDCVRSLEEYNNRIFMLMNILPNVREYISSNPSGNEGHQKYLLGLLDEHMGAVNEFRNSHA